MTAEHSPPLATFWEHRKGWTGVFGSLLYPCLAWRLGFPICETGVLVTEPTSRRAVVRLHEWTACDVLSQVHSLFRDILSPPSVGLCAPREAGAPGPSPSSWSFPGHTMDGKPFGSR